MLAENFRCRAFGIQVVARLDLHLVSAVSSDVSVTDMQHFLHEFSLLKPFLGVVVDIAAETSAGEIYLFSGGGLTRLEHGRAHCSHVLSEGRSIIDLLFREGDFFIQAVLLYDSEHPVDFHQLIRNVTLLMPHVHKSFRIFYRLEKYRNYVAGFELALDHLSKGLLLFDGHGDIAYQNSHAREIIGDSHAISLISGKMYGTTPEYTRAIRRVIRDTIVCARQGDRKIQAIWLNHDQGGARGLPAVAIPIVQNVSQMIDQDTAIYAALLIGNGIGMALIRKCCSFYTD